MLCCGYTLTDFPISIRLTSLALWQSNDCPSASKATLMNMDKYFMWIHYERLHNHNKAKHNKTVCIFFGIYCILINQTLLPFDWSIQIITVALKGHHCISFSLHYINFDLSEKILCDYVYIIILHVYIIILHVYVNILHVYLIILQVYIVILHVYIIIYTCIHN